LRLVSKPKSGRKTQKGRNYFVVLLMHQHVEQSILTKQNIITAEQTHHPHLQLLPSTWDITLGHSRVEGIY
jgi:hypothetical protein